MPQEQPKTAPVRPKTAQEHARLPKTSRDRKETVRDGPQGFQDPLPQGTAQGQADHAATGAPFQHNRLHRRSDGSGAGAKNGLGDNVAGRL